jgi:hypothetical protein
LALKALRLPFHPLFRHLQGKTAVNFSAGCSAPCVRITSGPRSANSPRSPAAPPPTILIVLNEQ